MNQSNEQIRSPYKIPKYLAFLERSDLATLNPYSTLTMPRWSGVTAERSGQGLGIPLVTASWTPRTRVGHHPLLGFLQQRKASVFTHICVKSEGTGAVLGGLSVEREREREHFFDKVKDNPIIFTSK